MKYKDLPADVSDVIKSIDAKRDEIYSGKKWRDGEYLSMVVVSLSALNSYLGEHIAQAKLDVNDLEAGYKAQREGRKLDLLKDEVNDKGEVTRKKVAATTADSQKIVDTHELYLEWNQSRYTVDLLTTKRNDTNNLIDAIRSRLSFMKSDKEKS